METLSVIIPVYNRESLIGRTLDSIAAQTLRPRRLIVVDNASDDDTLAVVERWRREKGLPAGMDVRILSERKPGASAARNRGLKEADTDWVMFFDSDDIMLPGHIERAMRTAAANPDADIVGWDVDQELADGSRRKGRFVTGDIEWNNIVHAVMATQRYMARTALFRLAGGWCEDAMVWNDWELGIRMLRLNPRVIKAEGASTVVMHFTPESITGTRRHADRCAQTLAIAESFLRRRGDSRLLRWLGYRRAVLAAECLQQGDAVASEAILSQALSSGASKERLAIRLTFLHARWLHRGAFLTYGLFAR